MGMGNPSVHEPVPDQFLGPVNLTERQEDLVCKLLGNHSWASKDFLSWFDHSSPSGIATKCSWSDPPRHFPHPPLTALAQPHLVASLLKTHINQDSASVSSSSLWHNTDSGHSNHYNHFIHDCIWYQTPWRQSICPFYK